MTETVFIINRPSEFIIEPSHEIINGFQAVGGQLCSLYPDKYSADALAAFDATIDYLHLKGKKVLDLQFDKVFSVGMFTRDLGAVVGGPEKGKFVVAKFRHIPRQDEVLALEGIFKEECLYRLQHPDATFEGGDHRTTPYRTADGKSIEMLGLGLRTNQIAHDELRDVFGKKVHFLPMVLVQDDANNEHFSTIFHEDLVLMVFMRNGDMMIYP